MKIETKRIKNYSLGELYEGENQILLEVISRFEHLTCADLVRLLDETHSGKTALPWEFRRAARIKHLNAEELESYYTNYLEHRLSDGRKQLALLRKVLRKVSQQPSMPVMSILDLGTGRGGFLAVAQQSAPFHNADFQGIDTDMASLLINQKINDDCGNTRYSLFCYSGGDLPFDDQSFDIIASFSTLEHVGGVGEQDHLLAECSRCLKPNGTAVITSPNKYNIVTPEEHVRIRFLDLLPTSLKERVSYFLTGMPSSDITPTSIFSLRRGLKSIPDICYQLHSVQAFHRSKIVSLLFSRSIFAIAGPSIVTVITKNSGPK